MQVHQLRLKVGREINLEKNGNQSIELGLDIILDPEEDHTQQYHLLKHDLEQQLDQWEHDTRLKFENMITTPGSPQPVLKSAKSKTPKPSARKTQDTTSLPKSKPEIHSKKPKMNEIPDNNIMICPECKEEMKQKEGKKYFVCSQHWGYPDMIMKGNVRVKQF